MRYFQLFIVLSVLTLLLSCGDKKQHQALGLTSGMTVSLTGIGGEVPVVIQFEDADAFTGTMDTLKTAGVGEFNSLKVGDKIAVALRFSDDKGQEHTVELEGIQNTDRLTKPIPRHTVPFSVNKISNIELIVGLQATAYYPPILK